MGLSRFTHSELFAGSENHIHTARFARPYELQSLIGADPTGRGASLVIGIGPYGRLLRVRSSPTRRELGNLLVDAPTRGGKGLLAVSQLLTWPHSVIVNDIKGDLFELTAGDRLKRGPVRDIPQVCRRLWIPHPLKRELMLHVGPDGLGVQIK